MKKRELLKLRSLTVTKEMMETAGCDKPHYIKYSHQLTSTKYKYGLYMRCHVQNGILVVAFFLTEHMKIGGQFPAYELYINRKTREFLTYDRIHEKWLTAMADRLTWPEYVILSNEKWINHEDSDTIKNYLGGHNGGYEGLIEFQRGIRNDELKLRHKKETDPWDKDLAQVPKLPKDWERWVDKVGIQQNYIFYNYIKKGADSGYCTYCNKEVPIKQPRHNKQGRCPRCRHKAIFKSIGKAGTVMTEREYMYLIQRCADGFVIREFYAYREYPKQEYQTPQLSIFEIRRVIYDKNAKNPRAYYLGLYKQCETRWIHTDPCDSGWYGLEFGKVYRKALPCLAKRELSKTGLIEVLNYTGVIDPEKYLAALAVAPYLEKLSKADLPCLLWQCLGSHNHLRNKLCDAKATSLTKMLGINTQQLKRLRINDGGMNFLIWLRYEKVSDTIIPDNIISWFSHEKILPNDVNFIHGKMSTVQIYNYIRRQMAYNKATSKDILIKWSDYLSMAKRLKIDINDEIIFRVSKLFQRHDELVERCHAKDITIRACEIIEKYPHVDDICKSLKDKYEYSDDEYTVLAPSCIEDIMFEGRKLSHCVSNSDRYWERIERRETYVLFLRKTSEIEEPYYTLEIEPNGTVRQKRTKYDRQNSDIENIKKFLSKWQGIISKRITEEDLKLAKESHTQRDLEYAQLRSDRKIIQTGDLAGKLLADVLIADLMENVA